MEVGFNVLSNDKVRVLFMRKIFKQQMTELSDELVKQAREAAKAMARSAESLKNTNLALAEQVIESDRKIDALEYNLNEMSIMLLARQQPVASDLRVVVSVLKMSATLERMGDLARHVSYVARGRYPQAPNSGQIYDQLVTMADHAAEVGQRVVDLLESNDLDLASRIEEEDDKLDELHRTIYGLILDDSVEMNSRQEIMDAILLARYLERYGDHAVSIARRVNYVVTGVNAEHDELIRDVLEAEDYEA